MQPPNSTSRIRRAQIFSLSLTELILLLVFMAITFSSLAKDEGLREVPNLRAQLANALKENARLTKETLDLAGRLSTVTQDLDLRKEFLERIGIDAVSLKPQSDTIRIDATHTYILSSTGGKAPGHPQCALKNRFLLNLSLLSGDQIQSQLAWDREADASVTNLPGIPVLAAGQILSLSEFETAAKALTAESLKSSNCVFAVKVTRETKDADAFDAELILVERYFDVSHH
jgi:hypothetical protein